MPVSTPLPRFRLYTRLWDYLSVARDAALGRVHLGGGIAELEQAIRQQAGTPYALCTPQGRVAVYLAVRSLIRPGQKVLLSPYTTSDIVNMVISAGGVPVFVDIRRETCNIDHDKIETSMDGDVGALLVTHLHGLACDMPKILRIGHTYKISVIEDAAQAFGTVVDGRWVGSLGDAGIFSFGMYKNLTGFYGGMLVTRRRDVMDSAATVLGSFPEQSAWHLLRRVRQGFVTDVTTFPTLFKLVTFWIFRYAFINDIDWLNRTATIELDDRLKPEFPDAYRARMTPLQGRLVYSKLGSVPMDNRARVRSAQTYHAGLKDISDLILPPLRTDGSHGYSHYVIQFEKRQNLLKYMMKEGCDVAAQHIKNCADLPSFQPYARDCPNARLTAQQAILLPTYPKYSQRDIQRNISVIRHFFGKG